MFDGDFIKSFNSFHGDIIVPSGLLVDEHGRVDQFPSYEGKKDDVLSFYADWFSKNGLTGSFRDATAFILTHWRPSLREFSNVM